MESDNEPSVDKVVIIIEIGAEGGTIKVLKRGGAGGESEYSVQLRDQTLKFLANDQGGSEIRRDSAWSASWTDVIKSLGRWPWPMLYPMQVAPDYRERVFAEVKAFRGRDGQPARASSIERWERVCG